MHYKNGREAKVGDLVRGQGYNLKYEFTGVITRINPHAATCNCTIATISHRSAKWLSVPSGFSPATAAGKYIDATYTFKSEADVEYGQLDAFVAINPNTGEVLNPVPVEGGQEHGLPSGDVFPSYGGVDGMKRNWTDHDHKLLKLAQDDLQHQHQRNKNALDKSK